MSKRMACLGLSLGSALALATLVHAQPADEWSLERTPVRSAARVPVSRSPEAERALRERALRAEPGSDDALLQLVEWERQHAGSLTSLLVQLRAAVSARPQDSGRRQALARVLMADGQVEAGLRELEQAAHESRDNGSALTLRARLLAELGRHAEAAAQLLALGEATDSGSAVRARWLRDAAREQLAAFAPEAALLTLKRAAHAGGAASAAELRGIEHEALRQSGRLSELAEALTRQAAWREAARVREELGDDAGALGAWRSQLARAPGDLSARSELARLLAKSGQLEAAQRETLSLVQRAPGEARYLVQWAELSQALGARDVALARLARASAAAPRAVALHRALRTLYLRWQALPQADHELALLAQLEPAALEHQLALADQALARGERNEALRLLSRQARQAGEAEVARLLGERDLLPEAIEHAQRAVTAAPQQLMHQRLLAGLLERAGRTADAERAWQALRVWTAADQTLRAEAREHLVSLWRRAGTERVQLAELEAQLASQFELESARLLLVLYAGKPEAYAHRHALLQRALAERSLDVALLTQLERMQLEGRELGAAFSTRSRLLELSSAEPGIAADASERAMELALQYPHEPGVPALVARALALAPRVGKLQRMAAALFTQRQEQDAARAAYERALLLDPRDFEACLALAEDALAGGDPQRAESLLRVIVDGALDESLLGAAAALLLQVAGERGELSLLRSLHAGEGRAAKLRVLLSHYARTLAPLAGAALRGALAESELSGLRRSVERATAALLLALVGGSQAARELAVQLLGAAALPSAVAPLLALAEQADARPQERCLALIGLARAHDARVAPRLRALYDAAEPKLRPVILWALTVSSPQAAASVLSSASRERDPAVRGMAVLLSPPTQPAVRAALSDQVPVVQLTARWQLRNEPVSATPVQASPGSRSELLALATAPDELSRVRALFADAAPARALAASVLTRTAASSALPAPRWPFDLEGYLLDLVQQRDASQRPRLASATWSLVEQVARERLLDAAPAVVLQTLPLLAVQHEGLLPTALLSSGACVPAAWTAALARALTPVLARLAATEGPARTAATLLLTRAGGADRPEIQAALEQRPTLEVRVLLEAVAGLHTLPAVLRPTLERLQRGAPDWPTRMWAVRALGTDAAALAQEPVALVRSAGAWPQHVAEEVLACDTRTQVTN